MLDQIWGDDVGRRDLLWLRAQEKGDEQSVKLLEQADPAVRARMEAFIYETGMEPDDDDPRGRRATFNLLWHERRDEVEGAMRRRAAAAPRGRPPCTRAPRG
ncbi:MAG TPA: hypothetical protein VGQ83_13210 [Polyangia bacterium]